jgi:TetR/AcrR family transcriptional regulator
LRRGEARKRILEAARLEFGRPGLAGARVGRIAKRAGVNKQLLYYYFGSKRDLFRAAAAPRNGPGQPSPRSPRAGPEAIRQAMRDLFEELAARPELMSLLVDRNGAERPLAREWADAQIGTIAALISEGQGTGYFRDDVDPNLLAQQAIVLCAGFHAFGHHAAAAADSWLTAACDTLLRGMAW